MEKLYNDGLINLYGEQTAIRFIMDNTPEDLFGLYENLLDDVDRENTKSLFTFENFLIKHYNSITNQEVKDKLSAVLNMLYDSIDYKNIPNDRALSTASNFFKCTLARNTFINLYASDEQKEGIRKTKEEISKLFKKIVDKYKQYFDKKINLINAGIDYSNDSELKNMELESSEKSLLLNCFISKDLIDDINLEDIKEKMFIDLISDTYNISHSIDEKEFLARYAMEHFFESDFVGMPEVSVANDLEERCLGGTAYNGCYIYINGSLIVNSYNIDIIQTACHEYQHIVQHKSKNRNNDLGYYKMIRDLPNNYIDDNEYETNYEYMEIELDAESTAYKKLFNYLNPLFKKYNLDVTLLNEYLDKLYRKFDERRPVFNSRKELNGESVPYYKYNIEVLEKIIKEHPEVINEYPVLNNIFDLTGNLKDFNSINLNGDYCESIIADYILYLNYNKSFDNYNFDNKSEEELNNFFDLISIAFDKIGNLLCNLLDSPNNLYSNNATESYSDLINEVWRLYKIVNNNFNIIINNSLKPHLFMTINRILESYIANYNNLESFFSSTEVNDAYFKYIILIIKSLSDIKKKYNNYIFEEELKERKDFVIKNNLLESNSVLVEKLKDIDDKEFLEHKFILNDETEISFEDFLDNYVKYNYIDGEILIKRYGKVPLMDYFEVLVNNYNNPVEQVENEEIEKSLD